jgi:glucose/arabinose dehydrogenase
LPVGGGTGGVQKQLVADLASPSFSTKAPGVADTIYVVELGGSVRVVEAGTVRPQAFLDISSRVSTAGEGGLLSIAFDPRYQSNGLLYAYYTTDSSHKIKIDEFRAGSDTDAIESSRRSVMTIPHPTFQNHQGGTIAFGGDGHLYAAPGDGGGTGDPGENAQDKGSLLGKVLRIDPHRRGERSYTVPDGNPFVGRSGRNEVFALGLRNPFRFSFDRDRILIGDVGQSSREEIDLETHRTLRGANFGWDNLEGTAPFEAPGTRPRGYEPPVHEYPNPAIAPAAVTGGVVVRDENLPTLYRRYLYADFYAGDLRSFVPRLGGADDDRALGVAIDQPSSFARGPGGTIYVTSLAGPLYRLVPE